MAKMQMSRVENWENKRAAGELMGNCEVAFNLGVFHACFFSIGVFVCVIQVFCGTLSVYCPSLSTAPIKQTATEIKC